MMMMMYSFGTKVAPRFSEFKHQQLKVPKTIGEDAFDDSFPFKIFPPPRIMMIH
jgi:hypothetical protein